MAKKPDTICSAVLLMLLLLYSRLVPVALPAYSHASPSPPLCAGSREPVVLGEALGFCGGEGGLSCCDAADDEALRTELEGMHISDETCAAAVKAFLCERCVLVLSAMLLNTADSTTTTKLSVPLLCASTASSTSAQYQPPTTRKPWEQDKLCLERISEGSYHTMAAHPDGSGRIFLSTRDGKILLASMPVQGSGGALQANRPFLDLTDRVHHDAVLGLVGVAFHPEFVNNGRFFVSYNCDSSSSPACGAGRCWGGAARNGSRPCMYQLVIAEFSAKGGGTDYSKATRADPSEVRRIFTMGLPHPHTSYSYQHHGGQILFQPSDSDGYLYLITGNGDVSKNGKSYLGKVLRFNVGTMPGEHAQTSRDTTKMDKPEIFAMGISNPSGCSFDSDRPSYLYCADVDEQQYERVYLFTKGGPSSKASVSIVSSHGRPSDGRMPSIVGGLVYRGSADPMLEGRYLHMYSSGLWISRRNRGYVSAQVPNMWCSKSSPLACHGGGIGIAGRLLSMGEDNSKDAFILATGGIYRVVPPTLCSVTPQPPPPKRSSGTKGPDWVLFFMASCLVFAICKVWLTIFGGGAQITVNCNKWFSCCYRKIRKNQ